MTPLRIQGTGLAAAALPAHILLTLVIAAGLLLLLIYAGIALPAVWSASPARRQAAADVLRQILTLIATITRNTREP